ncbi:MAG: PilZ domain-containing protein [Candidatus Acidiferrales bacterium]
MSSTRGNIEELFESLSERRDRRGCPRIISPLLTYIDLGDGNGGIAANISEGGLAITAAGKLSADYFPSIRFQLPKISGWIETSGRVVWTTESKKGAGICFEGITEVDRERIRHWISRKDSAGKDDESDLDSEQKHPSDPGERKKEPRKLGALSEADEAKFAAMFPSESTLQTARDHNRTETEVEREVAERLGQHPQEVAKDLLPDSDGKDLDARPSVEPSRQSTNNVPEVNSEGAASEQAVQGPELASREAEPAIDVQSMASESVDAFVFPRRRWIIDRADDSLTPQELPAGEHRSTQFEAVDPSSDHDNRPDENIAQAALFEEDEGTPSDVDPREIPAVEEETPGEWMLPTFTYPQEADWRQQFVWNRGSAATEPAVQPAVEKVPEHNTALLIAAVILLVAAVCFAGGLMVGNGSVRKLMTLARRAVTTNSPAATAPDSNSSKSNEPLEAATEQPKNDSSAASPAGLSNGSTDISKDSEAAQNRTSDSKTDAAQSAQANNDDQEAPASNRRRQERSLAPSSRASSSSVVGAESSLETEQVARRAPAAPESGPRSQGRQNLPISDYSEATVDKPYSELQSPVLVTPPDEKSGPFRLAFPEAAISASRTLAISAQRFVLIPVQPGPASGHRPERLQAGVLIYHVDPVLPPYGDEPSGAVKVRASIGKGGDVVDVRAISGPASLIPRVVRAVREWRYTVTLLDGQPLGAEEDVVVEFRPKR